MEAMESANRKSQNLLGKIDFSSPGMQPMIRMIQNNIRRETRNWQPAADIRLRTAEICDATDEPLTCLVLEPEESRAACLFCHGGGMIFPLQAASLGIAEYLARAAQISVWVPDYHLPPEAPFPVPLRECRRAWQEMSRASARTVLYGESIGGALAASLAICLRDHPEDYRPDRLMLIDPVTDCETERYPSAALDAQASWTIKSNRHMWDIYLPDGYKPYAVPIRERLDGLPPTYLETAGMDILRDEGEAFGHALEAAGVPVKMHRAAGARHGFDTETDHSGARQMLQKRVEYIREAFR